MMMYSAPADVNLVTLFPQLFITFIVVLFSCSYLFIVAHLVYSYITLFVTLHYISHFIRYVDLHYSVVTLFCDPTLFLPLLYCCYFCWCSVLLYHIPFVVLLLCCYLLLVVL